jgi:hypothetical protein
LVVGAVGLVLAACPKEEPAVAGDATTDASTGSTGSSGSGTGESSASSVTEAGTSASSSGDAESSGTTGDDPTPDFVPLCDGGLPFAIERVQSGDPVAAADLTAVTQQYLDMLEHLDWLDFVAQRAHGWPENDPRGRYWFATWWSGVNVLKNGGEITYEHGESGADNNGLRTGPVVEGVCHALRLWNRPEDAHLVHRLVRGFTAWMIAMERMPDDPDGPLLSRAFYPESIDAGDYFILYDMNRPGIDADPSEYVHVPGNPHWGDIWIKNKRSKDDIGHMLRAIAQLSACEGLLGGEAAADYEVMRTLYSAWARKVEDDGWAIATLDKDAEVWIPDDLLANFLLNGNAECDAVLSLRLLGRGDPGMLDCGNGIGKLDPFIIGSNDHNGNILRSFHEAAANNALLTGHPELAQPLMEGLALRLDEALDGHEGITEPVPWLTLEDTVDMLTHAAAVGVPLTWREVRWLHDRVVEAATSYADPANDPIIDTFDASVGDGAYGYHPWGTGLHFISLGAPLGTCASPCVDPSSPQVLDCDLVRSWSP